MGKTIYSVAEGSVRDLGSFFATLGQTTPGWGRDPPVGETLCSVIDSVFFCFRLSIFSGAVEGDRTGRVLGSAGAVGRLALADVRRRQRGADVPGARPLRRQLLRRVVHETVPAAPRQVRPLHVRRRRRQGLPARLARRQLRNRSVNSKNGVISMSFFF